MPDDTKQPAPPAGGGSQSRGATPGQDPAQATQPQEAANVLIQSEGSAEGRDGLTADEEDTLARLQAKAERANAGQGGTVVLVVEEPHSEMHYGGTVITREGTPVPEAAVAALENAAAGAGVKLTRKEEG